MADSNSTCFVFTPDKIGSKSKKLLYTLYNDKLTWYRKGDYKHVHNIGKRANQQKIIYLVLNPFGRIVIKKKKKKAIHCKNISCHQNYIPDFNK